MRPEKVRPTCPHPIVVHGQVLGLGPRQCRPTSRSEQEQVPKPRQQRQQEAPGHGEPVLGHEKTSLGPDENPDHGVLDDDPHDRRRDSLLRRRVGRIEEKRTRHPGPAGSSCEDGEERIFQALASHCRRARSPKSC